MLVTKRLEAPADALAIARALADRDALALVLAERGRTAYVACDPTSIAHALDPEPALERRVCDAGEIPRWIGLLPYEARRALERSARPDARPEPELVRPLWYRYQAVVRITNQVEVIGEDARVVHELGERVERGLRRAKGQPE